MIQKLSSTHQRQLHKAMLASFPGEGDLRIWVQFQLGERLAVIKKSTAFPEIVLDLFEWVESQQRWPEFLDKGRSSDEQPMLRDACIQILSVVSAPPAPAGPPAEADRDIVLADGAPFVDRQRFWIDVEELRTSKRKRVALVDGPPKSGKSYCSELLDHLRRERWGGARLALVDLGNDQSPDIKPDELCRRLLLKLRITNAGPLPEPLPGQKPDRWARDLAAWMAGQIALISSDVWIVLDGFDQQAVTEETHVFIAALAEEAGDQGEFRLVLLGYDKPFGERTNRATVRTRIDYLTVSELHAFLTELDAKYQVSNKPTWAAALELVEQYGKHTPGSATQIDALSQLLPQVIRSLLK